ncbi:MAG: alpha-galactosidase, partial [Oscillospiraceae bacterium]
DEQITMMTLWTIMRAPLIIGGEMTKFDDFTMSLLTNEALIEALNNTHSAHPLFRRKTDDAEEIAWFSTHTDGKRFYCALFNAGEHETEITAQLPISDELSAVEIWENRDMGTVRGSVTARVRPHGAAMICLTRK